MVQNNFVYDLRPLCMNRCQTTCFWDEALISYDSYITLCINLSHLTYLKYKRKLKEKSCLSQMPFASAAHIYKLSPYIIRHSSDVGVGLGEILIWLGCQVSRYLKPCCRCLSLCWVPSAMTIVLFFVFCFYQLGRS